MSLRLQNKNNSQNILTPNDICSEIVMFICYKLQLSKYRVAGSSNRSFAGIMLWLTTWETDSATKNQRALQELAQLAPAVHPSPLRNIPWTLCSKHTPKPLVGQLSVWNSTCGSASMDTSWPMPRAAWHCHLSPVPRSWAPALLTQLLLPSSPTSIAHIETSSPRDALPCVCAFSIFQGPP